MNLLHLKVITPEGLYFEQDIYRLDIKTTEGSIGVLAGHIPCVYNIDISVLKILNKDKKPNLYALHGGLLNVRNNETVIITSAIESKEEIDTKRAQSAKSNAQAKISSLKKEEDDYKAAEIALKRAITRLKL